MLRYILLYITIPLYTEIIFILDPVFIPDAINCFKNTYIFKSLDGKNIQINNDTFLNTDILFNNKNTKLIIENTGSDIKIINLPKHQKGIYYLTLDENNLLSVYTNETVKNDPSYDSVITTNIESKDYNQCSINNTSNNFTINIGDQNTSHIILYGKTNSLPSSIKTLNTSAPILFNTNQKILLFNKKVNVTNTTTCTKNTLVFNTITINNPLIINQNLTISKNNINFKNNTTISGKSKDTGLFTLHPLDGDIHFNNQDIILYKIISIDDSSKYLVINSNNDISYHNIPIINEETSIDTNTNELQIKAPGDIFISQIDNFDTNEDTVIINMINATEVILLNDQRPDITTKNPIHFTVNSINIRTLSFQNYIEFITNNLILTLDLGINGESNAVFNKPITLKSTTFSISSLPMLSSSNTRLVFNQDNELCLYKIQTIEEIEENIKNMVFTEDKFQNDFNIFNESDFNEDNEDSINLYKNILKKQKNNSAYQNSLLHGIILYDENNDSLSYNENKYVTLLLALVKDLDEKYNKIEDQFKNRNLDMILEGYDTFDTNIKNELTNIIKELEK